MQLQRLWFALLMMILTGGCLARPDLNTRQPHAEVDAPPVYGTRTVGQTFVARNRNLGGIELRWANPESVHGPLLVRLRHTPTGSDLVRMEIDPAAQAGRETLRIRFPALANAANTAYYLRVEAPAATAQQPLHLRAAPRDVYAPGTAYANGEPWPGDLAFRALYVYDAAYLSADVRTALRWIWLFLPAAALFGAPGVLLLRLWPPAKEHFDGWERLALATGLSLACIPCSLLWITRLGGRLNATTVRLLYGSLGATALAATVREIWRRRHHLWTRFTHPTKQTVGAWLLGFVLAAGLGARLLAIRDLSFPAWVDAVHHATLARIILEGGRVPATYAPYVPVEPATYHFGFHAAVAYFAWLSGLPVERAMLLVGQGFNALMALQVYLLSRGLTRRRWAARFAAFFVALLSTMPAYYVSWGRYTQLSGLLLLPVAVLLTLKAVEMRDRRAMALALLTQAGLILTHYRVLAFYVCFVGAWWLVKLGASPGAWRRRLEELGLYALLGLAAGALLLPWLAETVMHLWLRAWRSWGGTGDASSAPWDFSLSYAARGFDRYLLSVGAVGALLGLGERRRFSFVLLLWLGALFLVTNPSVVGLPGEGLTNNIAMLITWFIPQAIWSGFVIDELLRAWWHASGRRGRRLCCGAATLLFCALGAAGLYLQITILSPEGVLAVEADRAALAWIEAHTPPESRFLINARPWQGAIYMGTDGGYWITPLTGRQTTTPPALYPLGEQATTQAIRELNEEVRALAHSPAALAERLRAARVDYVYVGALGGPLDPQTLDAAPAFEQVYRDEYTRIYALRRHSEDQ
ncbi:MAG: DUF6541 family protein [Anaerolineae bacterium]